MWFAPWLTLLVLAQVSLEITQAQINGASELLDNRDGRNDRYAAIGRYRAGATCTAFWIDTGSAPSAPAYAVAAGHCIDLSPTKVYLNRPDNGTVTFHFFRDTADRRLIVKTRSAAYSTMKGLDVAILELDTTRGALLDAGLRPLEFAIAAPVPGDLIDIVGAPVTGIPDDESYLRRASCSQGPSADLVEATWHFFGASRNECSDIQGGSSGSPVLARSSGKVFGVLNTSTVGARYETGGFPCSNGQPCEISREGVRYRRDTNYTIPIVGLDRCFDATGRFDVTRAGCPLDPGRQLDFPTPAAVIGSSKPWGVTLAGNFAWYRYKTFAEGRDDCRDPAGYGSPIRLSDSPRIDDVIPATPGRYWLCVIGGNNAQPDSTWQEAKFASIAHVRVDTEPPTIRIPYVYREEPGNFIFDPIFTVPELSNYLYKIGTASNGSCAERDGYQIYRRFMVRVPKSVDLERFCLIGEDDAGNPTPPLEIALRGTQVLPEGVRNAASLRAVDPGAIAPGSLITLYGANLGESSTLRLTDSAGALHELTAVYTSADQINAYTPLTAATGPARIEVAGAGGRTTVPLTIDPVAPGVFTVSMAGGGSPSGFAERVSADGTRRQQPLNAAIDPPATGETLRIVVYTTGLARTSVVHMTLGGQALEETAVEALKGVAGVETVSARVPPSFRLAGYLPLEVSSGAARSNTSVVRIRAR